ncbi:MAG: hypothetical protein K2I20_04120 [Clostridia bacterium]|nr:hypothetical protein [Clostridia bacterium]
MKTTAKRTGAMISVAAYALTLFTGLGFIFGKSAFADTTPANEGLTYFYEGLKYNPRATKFYNAFETLNQNGSFKKNEVDFDIVGNGVSVAEDVKSYVEDGDSKLPVAFSAGRDAFLMDHPDIFYADLFGVSLSAGVQNGNYVAFLDTSRTDTLYNGHINTPEAVNEAITEYEEKLNVVVSGAKAAGDDAKTQIEYVNKYISDNVEYDFCTTPDGYLPDADYIDTAYGALVNGKAICGGYAKAFKAVLDRLNIPCVCVQGYSCSSSDSQYVAHMWNAVKLEGQWYAVDPTWNDTTGKNDWLFLGEKAISRDHVEDPVISSSGYELKYPALKPYNYGNDTDDNGMTIKGEYGDNPDGNGKTCKLTIVYDGMGAKKLEQQGKYLATRLGDKQEDGSMKWSVWYSFVMSADLIAPSAYKYDDKASYIYMDANIDYIQFAIIDYAPDESLGATYPEKPEYGDLAGKPCYYVYNSEKLTDEHISQPSTPYQNEGYGSYIPAPGANVTPTNTGKLKVDGTYEMKFVYTDTLVLAEGKTIEDVGLNIETARGNDTVNDNVEVTDFKWDGNKTITFTFKPSKMFIHNGTYYYFTPTNLVGKRSNKTPDPVSYVFSGKNVVCSKIFNDGRLYISSYGTPNILDTSNLALNDFKDEDGNYYAKDQRSQLLLVADKAGNKKTETMLDMLETKENIAKEDIVTTATYEISLQLCGVVTSVPNGSYLQVAFGFPEGFSPDDEGTTFKIYHYTHDNKGNITGIEEIPVIITQYGLIAKVTSFSPFTVVQVKKSAVEESQTKSVYASVIGNGGSIDNSGINVVEGDEITYNITAQEGYQLDKVMLNGEALENVTKDTTAVTLTKEQLAEGNTLEFSFVRSAAAESYAARGIEIKTPNTIVLNADEIASYFAGPDTNSTAVWVTVGVLAVTLACSALAIYIAVVKTRPAKRRR